MTDVVDRATRSRMMAAIKGRDTKPELLIRKGLFSLGWRYRLHQTALPGKPDIVVAKARAAVFVDGCFWHRHECQLFRLPATNRRFWDRKLNRNKAVDAEVTALLLAGGWRVMRIWECSLKGKARRPVEEVVSRTDKWLRSTRRYAVIECRQ